MILVFIAREICLGASKLPVKSDIGFFFASASLAL